MLNYQILNISHSEQVKKLFKKYPLVFNGYTDSEYEKYLSNVTDKIFNNEKYFNIGLFHNEELKTVIILKEFSNFPAWCWAHYVGKWELENPYKEFHSEFLNLLLKVDEVIFHEMEDVRNLYRWHYVYNHESNGLKSVGGIERLLKFSRTRLHNTRLSKYNFQTECVLMPNTLPKYSYQKNLILDRSWPIRLGFRIAYKTES